MANAIADALTNLKAAREETALSVAEAQTRLSQLDQMIARLESDIVVVDPEFLPRRKDYEGLGITEAAKRFLSEIGEEKTTPEIAKALLERGLKTRSKRLVPTVFATLNNSKDFKRNGSGRSATWALKKDKQR